MAMKFRKEIGSSKAYGTCRRKKIDKLPLPINRLFREAMLPVFWAQSQILRNLMRYITYECAFLYVFFVCFDHFNDELTINDFSENL